MCLVSPCLLQNIFVELSPGPNPIAKVLFGPKMDTIVTFNTLTTLVLPHTQPLGKLEVRSVKTYLGQLK